MFLVDGRGHLLFANRSALRLFAEADGLALSAAGVRAWNGAEDAAMRGLITGALAGSAGAGTFMTITRPSARRPLSLHVTPLKSQAPAETAPAAVIFVADYEQVPALPAEMLGELYGLTPAEARVSRELVRGVALQEIAEAFGVSLNTVRNQLKQVYRKTGTSRQAELVSLVLSRPTMMPEEAPARRA